MLIGFSIENWMSFRDKAIFSMIASLERQHGKRVARLEKYKTRVLPVAAIYGGNASGKTNLFKALEFAKKLVVEGTKPDQPINVEQFRLDTDSLNKPTRFYFELLIEDTIYEFSFAVTKEVILEEKLTKLTSTSETVLYDRSDGKLKEINVPHKDEEFFKFVFKGTRNNQLFLTNSVSQNAYNFKPIHNWFDTALELIGPDSRFGPFERFFDENHPLYSAMSDKLWQLDTGISHLGGEEISIDNIPFINELKSTLLELKDGTTVRLPFSSGFGQYFVTKKETGKLIAKRLMSYHLSSDGTEVKFDIRHESDGSRRVIDLLPAFLDLSENDVKRVFVIDELDRSLHTLLTRQLLEMYLANCSAGSRSQLLFTTHDALLMDQKLLRRDEMWVTERDYSGNTSLFSFSEYKDIRYDKDIRKSYLQGRLGGIPRFLFSESRTIPSPY